jgi:pterin-4a-carbinolamine dehydratase
MSTDEKLENPQNAQTRMNDNNATPMNASEEKVDEKTEQTSEEDVREEDLEAASESASASAADEKASPSSESDLADESAEREMNEIVHGQEDLSEISISGHDEEEEDDATDDADSENSSFPLLSIEEIVSKLRELASSEDLQRKEMDELKSQFYRSIRNETAEQKAKFLANGGEEIDFVPEELPLYTEGKELLAKIKEKRAQIQAREEAEKEQNVAKKLAIIEQIKQLTENPGQEDFNKTYQEFRLLQQQWNDIKLIPQAKANELWKSYQLYVERFYDLVRINNEFREYDFKKNLELKTELCEAAERLDEEPDVISAFHQLQNLHQQWREIGPVSRKDREEIWNRFKEASNKINKKYQAHFEEIKLQENENLEKKTAICEQLESIDYSALTTQKAWREQLDKVLALQDEWRKIGYVPKKWNSKIYERYRAACNIFFEKKNQFQKSIRDELDENLRKKTALCEQAEALKDSKDWRKTTQEMIRIQKEWKEIGPVPRKFVDSLWQRFISACDYFFEQKKLSSSSHLAEEQNNLEAKKAIIEKINNIDPQLPIDEASALLHQLIEEWHNIGHVPFKQKDTIYSDFYEATEAQFNRLNIDKGDRKLQSYRNSISDMAKSDNGRGQLLREREKLMRQYDRMKNELQTYENNLGFLSVSSKKGNNLIDEMNQRVKRLRSDLDLLIKKIDAIDKEL